MSNESEIKTDLWNVVVTYGEKMDDPWYSTTHRVVYTHSDHYEALRAADRIREVHHFNGDVKVDVEPLNLEEDPLLGLFKRTKCGTEYFAPTYDRYGRGDWPHCDKCNALDQIESVQTGLYVIAREGQSAWSQSVDEIKDELVKWIDVIGKHSEEE